MTQITVQSERASEVIPLLRAALDHEIRVLDLGIDKTRRNLSRFEAQFGMESQVFYRDFQAGKLGDRMEYIKWAGEVEALEQLEVDRKELGGAVLNPMESATTLCRAPCRAPSSNST